MSKISSEQIRKSISDMLKERKERKFTESVELQIGLRDYDPEKDKRFSGAIKLPNLPHPNMKVAILGSAAHCDQAKAAGIDCIDVEGLKKFNKDKKLIKKWAKPYDVLLASDSLMKLIPKLLGNILVKIGKFPYTVLENESVAEKAKEQRQTVRFALKKVLCMGTRVGNVKMNEEELRQNIMISINFLVSLLKKGWHNIRSLHIKTSMGKSFRIYG
jgi:large subunit ribosomal protein L10Ae